MKKEKKSTKNTPYIDYECKVGERVQWRNLLEKKFEGTIISWDENAIATVKMDDDSIELIQC